MARSSSILLDLHKKIINLEDIRLFRRLLEEIIRGT